MIAPREVNGHAEEGLWRWFEVVPAACTRGLVPVGLTCQAWHTVTYGQFSRELGMPNHRNLNHVLGAIGWELEALSKIWGEEIPAINCIVVNKHNQTPGRGIQFHMSIAEFKKLPAHIQRQELQKLHRRVFGYPNWDKMLRHFGMVPVQSAANSELKALVKKAAYGRGAGEAEDHRLLKEFLAKHPRQLKLPVNVSCEIEYAFASADKIDLLFRCPHEWVGVEVKGIRSSPEDILRGIYQCVKYQALIEATQKSEGRPIRARMILALGGELPLILEHLASLLEIDVRRRIAVLLEPHFKAATAGAC